MLTGDTQHAASAADPRRPAAACALGAVAVTNMAVDIVNMAEVIIHTTHLTVSGVAAQPQFQPELQWLHIADWLLHHDGCSSSGAAHLLPVAGQAQYIELVTYAKGMSVLDLPVPQLLSILELFLERIDGQAGNQGSGLASPDEFKVFYTPDDWGEAGARGQGRWMHVNCAAGHVLVLQHLANLGVAYADSSTKILAPGWFWGFAAPLQQFYGRRLAATVVTGMCTAPAVHALV